MLHAARFGRLRPSRRNLSLFMSQQHDYIHARTHVSQACHVMHFFEDSQILCIFILTRRALPAIEDSTSTLDRDYYSSTSKMLFTVTSRLHQRSTILLRFT